MRYGFLIVLALLWVYTVNAQDRATETRLYITGNGSTKLPDSVYAYKKLEVLELTDFKLSKVPKDLKVERLVINRNGPKRRLKLSKNSTIKYLVFRGDETNKLPRRYNKLKKLESLQLSRCNVKKFPNVKGCDALKVLDLNNNSIEVIRPTFEKLKNLNHLSLYKNEVKVMPDFLFNVKSLHIIDFNYNHLREIPAAIAKLENLEVIYISENELTSLPDEIGELINLKELYIHHNLLTSLPLSIQKLTSLYTLRFNHNNVNAWPDGVTQLKGLSNLDCSFNKMTTLPLSELDFPNVKLLSFAGNPWDPKVKADLEVWADKYRKNGAIVHVDVQKLPGK